MINRVSRLSSGSTKLLENSKRKFRGKKREAPSLESASETIRSSKGEEAGGRGKKRTQRGSEWSEQCSGPPTFHKHLFPMRALDRQIPRRPPRRDVSPRPPPHYVADSRSSVFRLEPCVARNCPRVISSRDEVHVGTIELSPELNHRLLALRR